MDLPPSKLSGTASRLWSESAGQFQKKTDLKKIDLGLGPIQSSTTGEKDTTNSAVKPSTSSTISRGYVFGSRVSERVTKTTNHSDEPNDKHESMTSVTTTASTSSIGSNWSGIDSSKPKVPMDVSSIFKRMAEQSAATNNCTSTTNLWKTTTAPTATTISNGKIGEATKEDGAAAKPKTSDSTLEESANELAKKSGQQQPDSEAEQHQEIRTGEEDERNLLHISCKFHQFNVETKAWQERGMGSLKVNQHIASRDEVRLVGRQSGSQRVLLNSKIFPEMVLEELSEKRLKISAQTNESELPQLFLIQASPASVASLQHLLRKYIDACNMVKAAQHHLQIRKRRLEKPKEEGEEKKGEGRRGDDEGAEEGDEADEEQPVKKFISKEGGDEKEKEEEEEEKRKDEEEEEYEGEEKTEDKGEEEDEDE